MGAGGERGLLEQPGRPVAEVSPSGEGPGEGDGRRRREVRGPPENGTGC